MADSHSLFITTWLGFDEAEMRKMVRARHSSVIFIPQNEGKIEVSMDVGEDMKRVKKTAAMIEQRFPCKVDLITYDVRRQKW